MLIHCWYLQTDTFQTKLLFQTFETQYLLNKSMGCHMESGQHHKESEILWTTGTKILLMMWLVSYDHVTGYWPLIGQLWWSTIVYLLMITRTEMWVMNMARLGPDIIIWRQAAEQLDNIIVGTGIWSAADISCAGVVLLETPVFWSLSAAISSLQTLSEPDWDA